MVDDGKSLEHHKSKVKKGCGQPPPSIWTEGKNGRRMLYDEPDKTRRWGTDPPDR